MQREQAGARECVTCASDCALHCVLPCALASSPTSISAGVPRVRDQPGQVQEFQVTFAKTGISVPFVRMLFRRGQVLALE